MNVRHPAKYTDALFPVFARLIPPATRGLDPFGGTGKIFKLYDLVDKLDIACVEIEPECAASDSRIMIGNALDLPFEDGTFDWICTSPTYGNRMADHHEAKDKSTRNTYRHALGRPLHRDNAGALQWGRDYQEFHLRAWKEAWRVLKPGGRFILNCKDHIRRGRRVGVCAWHVDALLALGFLLCETIPIACPGNRFGQNGKQRVEHELVFCFGKPSEQDRLTFESQRLNTI